MQKALNKTVNLCVVYLQWLHHFQLPLFQCLNITVKSMMHVPLLYIPRSSTRDISLLSFRISDSDTKYALNKKLKMRLERRSCSLQNLHLLKATWHTWIEREAQVDLSWYSNCAEEALPKQKTKGGNSSFSLPIPAISKQERWFCVNSEDTHSLNTYNSNLHEQGGWKKHPAGTSASAQYYTAISIDGRKMFVPLFLPLLLHGNICHLRSWDYSFPTGLTGLEMGKDTDQKILFQMYHHQMMHWDDGNQSFKWPQRRTNAKS